MKNINNSLQQKLIRFTYEKPVNGGIEKREFVLTGYHGMVLVILAVLAAGTLLIMTGTEFF